MSIKIGNSPESWGVVGPDDPDQTPWHRFLDEVTEAGYECIELGPYGYLPTDPLVLRSELEHRGLRLTAAGLLSPLEDPSAWPDLKESALRAGDLVASLGGSFFLVVDGFITGGVGRRADPKERLDKSQWDRLIETTHKVAELAHDRLGLQLAFHPCADTHVQFEDQIEAFLEETDPKRVSLCLDTGHHAYRGGDPVSFMRKHHERIPYLHLKSVDAALRKRVNDDNLPMTEAVKMGMMCEPDIGAVDFKAFGDVLREVGYDGYCVVEQDTHRPPLDVPFQIAKRTRDYLRHVDVG